MVAPPQVNHHAVRRDRIPMLMLQGDPSRYDLPQTLDARWEVSFASTLEEAIEALTAIRRHRLAQKTVVLMDPRLPFLRTVSRRIRAVLPGALLLAPAPDELRAMNHVLIPELDVPLASRLNIECQLARRASSC